MKPMAHRNVESLISSLLVCSYRVPNEANNRTSHTMHYCEVTLT